MTEEQKEILIAKMLDAPSSLSDEELDAILQEDELRDIYEASSAVCSACVGRPELDMEAEWQRFRPRIRRKPATERWIMRVAAIFLGVMFVSAIIGKIIDNIFTSDEQPVIAKVEHLEVLDNSSAMQQDQQANETEDKALNKPAINNRSTAGSTRHLAKAETIKPKHTSPQEIDVDEYLRIQQARIDNDLAMQAAAAYMDEYDDLVPIFDAAGAYNPALDDVIKKVTME